jgi:hypothetical protein
MDRTKKRKRAEGVNVEAKEDPPPPPFVNTTTYRHLGTWWAIGGSVVWRWIHKDSAWRAESDDAVPSPVFRAWAEAAEADARALGKASSALLHSLGEYVRQSMHANPEWRSGVQAAEESLFACAKRLGPDVLAPEPPPRADPTEVAQLRAEAKRLREALEGVLAVSRDRQAFVMMGPRAFARAERIALDALEGKRDA